MSVTTSPIRVALVGCGQIADAHLSQIRRIRFADPVAVCDVHPDLAYQAAVRFEVPAQFTSIDEMVETTRPDVVHLTTPAHTHAALTKKLLGLGCHVYVEKPFTLDAQESLDVLATAASVDKTVCVGHDQLFDPTWLTAKKWIQRGLIGDVRHLESVLGYPIDGKFGSLVASDSNHWVRKLPGGLFQNTISHPLYRITDLLNDSQPDITAHWRTRDDFDFPTELSVQMQGTKQTGSLTFSTDLPHQRITRVYGTDGTLDLDFDAQTLRLSRRTKLPGAFAKLEAPFQQFRNSCWNLRHNMWRFLKADIHYFAGMKTLFEEYYAHVQGRGPIPIEPDEIHRVALLMDRIFEHCRSRDDASENPMEDKSPQTSEAVSCL
ncbi:MAG: Gfo/Idh/MocA family oxidoreductase [Planctomycetaceae bacterium]|nr:Gfo/Idh/MocA family oxidoreductase [Planctomycetaceae bacterium]